MDREVVLEEFSTTMIKFLLHVDNH
jgi:hypothetical protein